MERVLPEELAEEVRQFFFKAVEDGGRMALAVAEELPPLMIDWSDDGVGLQTLQETAAAGKRSHELASQVTRDAGVRAANAGMIKTALSAPTFKRFVIAPKDATAEVEIADDAMQASVTVHPPNHGSAFSLDDLRAVVKRKGITAGIDDEAMESALRTVNRGKKIITAPGKVSVQHSILHSRISANEVSALERRGTIIGGRVSAKKSVEAKVIGAPSGTKTVIQIGGDPFLIFELEQKKRAMERREQRREELKKLQADIDELAQKVDDSFAGTDGKLYVESEICAGTTITIGPETILLKNRLPGCTATSVEDLQMRTTC